MRISDWSSDVCSSDLGNVQTLIRSETGTPSSRLDRDLAAQFHHAVRRQAEIFHRAFRIAQHPREQFFAPDRHPRRLRRAQRLARQETAGKSAELRAGKGCVRTCRYWWEA